MQLYVVALLVTSPTCRLPNIISPRLGMDFSIFLQQARAYIISDRICELAAGQADARNG